MIGVTDIFHSGSPKLEEQDFETDIGLIPIRVCPKLRRWKMIFRSHKTTSGTENVDVPIRTNRGSQADSERMKSVQNITKDRTNQNDI
jgi:hypothetical protein